MYFPGVEDLDDITSEWETLKTMPGSKPQAEGDISDGMIKLPHPNFVYRMLETQYGMRYASVWRMKCLGQKRRAKPVYPRVTDCWIVQYDVMIWKGDRYDQLATSHPRDINRIFLAPKNQCQVTLDELRVAFARERDRNLHNAAEQVTRLRTDIATREREIADTEAHIAQMTGFMPEFDE